MIAWSWTLWKYATRQLRRRPGRTSLTLLGIVCGVAMIVAVTLTTQATRRAYHDMFANVTGRAALEVVAEGLGGFDSALGGRLEQAADVEAALPVIQSAAALLGRSGTVPVLVLGVDPARDSIARDYRLHSGRVLEASDGVANSGGVLLEAGFAQAHGLEPGQSVRLWTPTGIATLPVMGLLKPGGATAFNGGAVVFMPLTTAQRTFALESKVNSVQIVLREGSDAGAAQTSLEALVPTGLRVQTPSARGERSRDALYSIEQSLTGVSLVTLVAGAFVILNTFLINLTERRRQLAIWRALGATASQVTGLLLREAALLGFAGAVLGMGAGYVLGALVLGIMEQVLGGVSLPMLAWTNDALWLAFAFGPGMALAATWLPARRAAARAPLDDLLARGGVHNERQRRWPAGVGLALIATQLLGALGIGQGWLAPVLLAPLMPLGFIGFVLMMPVLIPPLMRWVRWGFERSLGFEGRLAMRQLERRPVRTSLTVGILSVAMVVGISVGHGLLASVSDTRDWSRRVALADFYVRGAMPDGAYAITMAVLPEKLEGDLARLEAVEQVDKLNWVLARANGERVVVLACTMALDRPLAMDLEKGDPAAVARSLLNGEVAIGTALAQKLRLGLGDDIELETRAGPRRLRIAGTVNEYTIDGMALYLEWHAAKQLFAVEGVHVFMISAEESKEPVLAGHLKAFCDQHRLILHSQAELRGYIDRAVLGVAGLVWALLAMVFVVAALGMVNTLTMNVLEQTRELGMLRAVGLQRRQLRKLILAQALAVAFVSMVPSAVAGLGLAYVINMLSDALLAHAVPFRIDPVLLGGCLAAGTVITLLAAVLPAKRAARLEVVRALQYE